MDILSPGFIALGISCIITWVVVSDMTQVIYVAMKGHLNIIRALIACSLMTIGPFGFIFLYGFLLTQPIVNPVMLGIFYGVCFSIPFLFPASTQTHAYNAARASMLVRMLWLSIAGAIVCLSDHLMNGTVSDYGWVIVPSLSFVIFFLIGCGVSSAMQICFMANQKITASSLCKNAAAGAKYFASDFFTRARNIINKR